jgi:protein-disulfide isomerase
MRTEKVLSFLLTTAAVVIAVTMLHREFGSPRSPSAILPDSGPEYQKNWRDLASAGTRIGDSAAAINVVVFSDFECPFCKRFDDAYEQAAARHGAKLALTIVHFPLPMHRFAHPAAVAAECAKAAGAFGRMTTILFQKQDSLGLKSWASFASEAGIRDTIAYAKCAYNTRAVPAIQAGLSAGERANVTSTPLVLVNGWRYQIPPTATVLEDAITALLANRRPPNARGATH